MISLEPTVCSFAVFSLVAGFSLNDVTERSHRLLGSNYVTETVRNFYQCQGLCNRHSLCKSVNYDTRTKECTSNYYDTVTSPTPLQSTYPGSVFVEKRTLCKDSNCRLCECEDNEMCVQLGHSSHCLTEEIDCGDPPDVANSRRSVDGTLFTSTSNYNCDVGFNSSNNLTMTSVCEVTGRWTSPSFTCVEIDCGDAPDIANSKKSVDGTSVNSTSNYSCDVGFNSSNNLTMTSVCDVTGRWTSPSFTCVEIDCGDPPDVANSKKSVDGTSVNSTSNYSCDVGYISIDNSTMTSVCDVTGRWTSLNFTCFDTCTWRSDCYTNCTTNGRAMYDGRKSTTGTGITCQRWDLQVPHVHSHSNPDVFPDDTISAAENYCRDPDRDGFPWCYTTDHTKRWRTCGIPRCY